MGAYLSRQASQTRTLASGSGARRAAERLEMPHVPVKVAVVQTSPVILDRDATVERACNLIAEAGRNGANLVVFPEAFIPAYPEWVWRIPPAENRLISDLYAEFLEQSIRLPGPESVVLGEAARCRSVCRYGC